MHSAGSVVMFLRTIQRSLSSSTLFRVGFRVVFTTIVVTTVGYRYVASNMEEREVSVLEGYVRQRADHESVQFGLASEDSRIFVKEFGKLYANSAWTPGKASDSITVLRSKSAKLDDGRTLGAACEIGAWFGRAYQDRFQRIYFVSRSGSVVVFDSSIPQGRGRNPSAWIAPELHTFAHAPRSARSPEVRWTHPRVDPEDGTQIVTSVAPLYIKGAYLGSVCIDIGLTDLIARTARDRLASGCNAIVSSDGSIITNLSGKIRPSVLGASQTAFIKTAIAGKLGESRVATDSKDDTFVGLAKLRGPNWFFATVVDQSELRAGAFDTAKYILLLGLLSMAIELMSLSVALRKNIQRPLAALLEGTNRIAEGDLKFRIDLNREDELAHLAGSFNKMSEAIAERDRDLEIHASQLKGALHDAEKGRQEAESASKLKSEFLSNLSHEVRTPMNGVIGMADLLLETELNEEQRDWIETIHTSGSGLLKLIDNIIDLSKLESGNLLCSRQPLSVREVLAAAISRHRAEAEAKGLELEVSVGPNVPPFINGDPAQLVRVVDNLVGNAVKFTPKGYVRVVASVQGKKLQILVRDTGIGVSPEDQKQILMPFRQADGSSTRKYGGTGIGLALSNGLAQAMGGKLCFESEPGAGSRFWVDLPLEASANAA